MRFVGRTGRLSDKGAFAFTRASTSRTTYFVVAFGPVDVTSVPGGCSGYSPVAGGCVTATLSEIDSNVVRVKAQRKR